MFVCDACGAENTDGRRHCHACGLTLFHEAEPKVERPEPDLETLKRKHRALPLPALPVQFKVVFWQRLWQFAAPVTFALILIGIFVPGEIQHDDFAQVMFIGAGVILLFVPFFQHTRLKASEQNFCLGNILSDGRSIDWHAVEAAKVGYIWRSGRSGRYRVYLLRIYPRHDLKPVDIRWKEWKPEDISLFLRFMEYRAPSAHLNDQVHQLIEHGDLKDDALAELSYSLIPGRDDAMRAKRASIIGIIVAGIIAAILLVLIRAR
jgi:hypothetical protein